MAGFHRLAACAALCLSIAVPALAQNPADGGIATKSTPSIAAVTSDSNRGVAAAGTEVRGYLSPKRYTTLSSELPAKVEKISVREGDRFKQGQALVDFDCSIQRAQLERARAILADAEKLHAAHEKLVELKSAGSLEADKSGLEVAKAHGDMLVTQAVVSKCAIRAPFSGRVTEQKVRAQEFVQAGQPLLEILDDSQLELQFIAPSRWLAWLKVGKAFKVHIGELDKDYPAKVERIGAKVDPVSQSVKIVGQIEGSFPELVAGMSGRILLAPPQ